MKRFITPFSIILLVLFFSGCNSNKPAYKNPDLPVDERVEDLVSKMTLEQKVSQMDFASPAIDSLDIPAYNWWNEALHGVARSGLATVFPQAIGLAAMWDTVQMYKIATIISDEARAKYNHYQKLNKRGIYQGLTFWSPNINIFRDPRWGRGMETYGEDPYLTGMTALQFIKGMQGDNPHYFKTIATSKHFAVHSGPEPLRHSFDAVTSDYDLWETYLPAFEMTVKKGHVQSVMCAYNSFRGKPCCGNDPLLQEILRNEWGFDGYIVSDCGAIRDFFDGHNVVSTPAQASAKGVLAGTDLNCGNVYPSLVTAVDSGYVNEQDIDISVKRLFRARMELGMFDPPGSVPYDTIPYSVLDSKSHREAALETARKSMVLLKNDNGLLPLSKSLKTIAVIGPNADNEEVLLGNYNGTPAAPVTPLTGIREKLPNTKVIYALGCEHAANLPTFEVIPASNLFTSSAMTENGLKASYFNNAELEGDPILTRIDPGIDFNWWEETPLDSLENDNFSIRWTGVVVPDKTGRYAVGGEGLNSFKIYLNDSLLTSFNSIHHPAKRYKFLDLEAGKPYSIKIEYAETHGDASMHLLWAPPTGDREQKAIAAAKEADVVVMFMGLSPRLEGEEMRVEVKGFSGGDRLTLDLPAVQQELIKKVYALGKPVVLVLLNGSALSINWEQANIPAILEAWYPGQAGGTAIADVLFGDYNPAGRLPVTFYKSVDQLPPFKDYSMKNRTYRYFDGEVLYPFGFGKSYTTFSYAAPEVENEVMHSGDSNTVTVEVTNNGSMDGDEVVQLYIRDVDGPAYKSIKDLRGFRRIHLKAGETQKVAFKIDPEMLTYFDPEAGEKMPAYGEFMIMTGSSSADADLKSTIITLKE
ncbi:MAG TPA: glycoside hydrolase family 3 C-terminal domain-containing protein [Bacteroidales bacterium]|nr:glycoside hydrolase family 3 C-terminal domain-containing protein [Bacteroidales bacterium]